MKRDAAEHAGVMEYERVVLGEDHEMIVFPWFVRGRRHAQLATHAQVDAQPSAATEAKEHLFRPRLGRFEFRAEQRATERREMELAQRFFLRMSEYPHDALADGGEMPAFAEKLHFGEFRHFWKTWKTLKTWKTRKTYKTGKTWKTYRSRNT